MDVVGGDGLEAELFGEAAEPVHALELGFHAVVVQLEVVAVLAEDIDELADALAGLAEAVLLNKLVDLTADAATQADEPARAFLEGFLVDARLVINTIEMGEGVELGEIGVAFVAGGE